MQFSTESLPIAQRPGGYESALRDYFSAIDFSARVEVEAAAPESFNAGVERVGIGQMTGARHYSNWPHRLRAQPVLSAVPGLDFYFLRSGNVSFFSERGEIPLSAGDMFLLRSDVEFSSCTEQFDMVALGLPDSMMRDPAAQRRWSEGQKISGGSGFAACLGSLLDTAVGRHGELNAAEGAVLQGAITDCVLLLSARGPEAASSQGGLSSPQQEKLSHLKTLALQSIQLPDLSPCLLAREAGVSPRTLHRLFNGSGVTFRSWLRDCRLERCWMELTDPARQRNNTIAAVAFHWGFNDLRTFNRAFSARYGMTPQAAREAGRAGSLAVSA